MIDVAKFVYRNYTDLSSRLTFTQVLSLVDRFEKNIVIVKDGDVVKGAAMYFMVDDLGLERIRTRGLDLSKPGDIEKIMERAGDNLHFFSVVADDMKTILKGLKSIIKLKKPKTVSWFKPNMIDFRIIKGA